MRIVDEGIPATNELVASKRLPIQSRPLSWAVITSRGTKMPIYRLWRQSDDKTFDDISARDDEHALELFGQELGIILTFAEGPAAPPYMMGRQEKAVSWTKPLDISVWDVSQNSN